MCRRPEDWRLLHWWWWWSWRWCWRWWWKWWRWCRHHNDDDDDVVLETFFTYTKKSHSSVTGQLAYLLGKKHCTYLCLSSKVTQWPKNLKGKSRGLTDGTYALLTFSVKWCEVYEISHIWTTVVNESKEWSSQ